MRGNSSGSGIFTIGPNGSVPLIATFSVTGMGASGGNAHVNTALIGEVGQTADMLQIQNSSNNVLASFSASGELTLGANSVHKGTLIFHGSTSGAITVQTLAAAGTWTMTLPNTDGNPNEVYTTDGAGFISWSLIDLTASVVNVLPVANGGTALASYTQGDLLYASGTTTIATLAKDTNATRYLSNTGTTNNPAWAQIDLTNGVTGVLPVANGGSGSAVKFQDNIALTNQSADIATTNFPNGGTAGVYRLDFVLEDTASDVTAGLIALTIAWTDDAGATVQNTNKTLTSAGRTAGTVIMQLASGNITYTTVHSGIFGSAKYALYMCLQRLS